MLIISVFFVWILRRSWYFELSIISILLSIVSVRLIICYFFFFYGNEFFKDSDNSDNVCEELFIREVEGCEVKDLFVFRVVFFGVFNVNDFRMIVYLRFSFYLLGIDGLFVFFRFGYRISRFSRFSVSNRFLFLLFSRKSIINL